MSLLMPVGVDPEEYRGYNGLPPPFEVSLPEGAVLDALRNRLGKHVDIDNDLALLRLIGQHTIGRVTFGGPLANVAELDGRILEAARSDRSVERLTNILRAHPQMFGVSGVMPKMSLGTNTGSRPGTLISHGSLVKFDSSDYPGASLVEYACLKACARVGLAAPVMELAPDRRSIIVGRFDRDDRGRRLGFEDACALSGLRRAGKYKGSVEHLFRMVNSFVHPKDQARDRRFLLMMVVMSDVLRNGDAHLKNFGLLYGDNLARPRLAPAYDMLTTCVWITKDTPAMPLRSCDDPGSGEWFDVRDLATLREISGLDCDMPALQTSCIEAAASAMTEVLDESPQGLPHQALERALRIVEKVNHPAGDHGR